MNAAAKMAAAALAVLALAHSAAPAAADPCAWPAGEVRLAADMFECFQTVAYSAETANHTGESVLRAMELYAFQDIAHAPPAVSKGFDLQAVNLPAEITRIANTAYPSDYAMQAELAALFRRLQDAHTRYIMPKSYGTFSAVLPFHLVNYNGEGGRQVVAVSPLLPPEPLLEAVQAVWEGAKNLPLYANATVLRINGEDALAHLTVFASTSVGLSKDLGTRLNVAVTSYMPAPTEIDAPNGELSGLFTQRHGDFAPFPEANETHVTFDLRLSNGTEVTVDAPWLAVPSASLDGTDAFRALWTASPATDAAVRAEVAAERRDVFHRQRGSALAAAAGAAPLDGTTIAQGVWADGPPLPRTDPRTGACTGSPYCFELLIESATLRFYQVVGLNDTVVVFINTFAPSEGSDLYEQTLEAGFAKAAALGLHKVLVSLDGNGGGDICIGRRTMTYLIDQQHPYPPTDMPASVLANAMARNAPAMNLSNCVWCADEYTSDEGKNFTSPDWLLDGHTHVRGNLPRAYSQLLHLSPLACSYDAPVPAGGFRPSQVKIVTHGLCGSTCAYFAQHAALYDHVELVAVGGLDGRAMDANSFPGFQVLDTPFLWQEISQHFAAGDPVAAAVAPAPLKTSARYRMCVREVYPHPDSAYPTEYTFIPADHRIPNTFANVMRPEMAWFDVLELFD